MGFVVGNRQNYLQERKEAESITNITKIASDRSDRRDSNLSRAAINKMAKCHSCGRDDGENYSFSDASIATMTWDHGDCLLMTPTDRTFELVINKGNLDCVM